MEHFVGKTIYGMKISFLVSFSYAYEDDGIVWDLFLCVPYSDSTAPALYGKYSCNPAPVGQRGEQMACDLVLPTH